MNAGKLRAYEDTGLSPGEIERMKAELSAYQDAAKQGRLVILPCKADETGKNAGFTTPAPKRKRLLWNGWE